ncbi:hypothetical protein [Demequina phytophila]|uniref:hypothetical protein n=1 Tax=Demequina phytophila TaxID=1638981 RepID=UPI0007865775|nr:hypothetical protein [Demequina phytophila]
MKTKLGMKLAAVGAAVLMTIAVAPASQAAGTKWLPIDKVPAAGMTGIQRAYVATAPKQTFHVAKVGAKKGRYVTFSITVPSQCTGLRWSESYLHNIKKKTIQFKIEGKAKNKYGAFVNMSTSNPLKVSGKTVTFKAEKTKPATKASSVLLKNVRLQGC